METMEKKTKIEMSLEEAKAWRASLYKPVKKALTEDQKKEMFRIFWAQNKSVYGKGKSIEKAIYLHLRAIGMNEPDKFADGIANFGLKKVRG